jgi:predicted nucleic acid-binding protein
VRAVFDTNIVIDCLSGRTAAQETLERYTHRFLSRISWIEVLVGARDAGERSFLEAFLENFTIVDTSATIGLLATDLRRTYRLRLPDALIWATARDREALFITRDVKDFSRSAPDIVIPYTL